MTAPNAAPVEPAATRELLAVREIATALLRSERPADVYQFALDRVTPLLGAAFSVVMQLGEDGDLLRPVAQHEWPAKHRAWIGALRVRVGDGPSGLAVAERRVVEVPDLFADPQHHAWHEVARELGFCSILAAPLVGARRTLGAIVFYFRDPRQVTAEEHALVRLVADQLATAAEKAATVDALRRANGALAEANAELESQALQAERTRAESAALLEALTAQLVEALAPRAGTVVQYGEAGAEALASARAIAIAARELVRLRTDAVRLQLGDVEARSPLQDAVVAWRERVRTIPLLMAEPTVLMPDVHTDREWMQRMLELVLGHALQQAQGPDAIVEADIELGRGFVAHRVRWRAGAAAGGPSDTAPRLHPLITPFDIDLARAIAAKLGGELRADGDEQGRQVTTVIPVEAAPEGR